ncbi:hypothetical protein BT96DRAFT_934816 [Gymnopus androsaceus JB14]|uniref:Uncharacterized protein n=1 Tax=Gymnopus androsaceus JB14 TaxID=1447944 RepID=A0A6A4I4X7_9AGAR|nr:hypothetical protein BT96DRAFT_934816 [Gymnopus androsaceus JB14]
MRFFSSLISLLAVALVATTAVVAQSAHIGAPADMAEVAGSFTAMIEVPDSLTSVTEVALVIALLSCASASCPGPSEELGTVLYDGPFSPVFTTEPGTTTLPPHQNFTLTVPESFAAGPAQLGVAHFSLIGASVVPFFETLNTTIVIT